MTPDRAGAYRFYASARERLANSPYAEEMAWQKSRALIDVTESDFLREYAWVVLNSGFREAVVRKHFNYLSLCFFDWESAALIKEHRHICLQSALCAFRNIRKLEAISRTASLIADESFKRFKVRVLCDPIQALQALPFLGQVTAFHLAKNIGLDVAKPDRHLVRLASKFGYSDAHEMCSDISLLSGDRVSVVDIVLWRFEEKASRYGGRRRTDAALAA